MDIRVVSESIFNIESDCIVYFVDNAFSNEDTMEIITKAGNRLLDVFSKISSLATGEFKTVPAFNLKATYVVLCSIPPKIEKEEEKPEVATFLPTEAFVMTLLILRPAGLFSRRCS